MYPWSIDQFLVSRAHDSYCFHPPSFSSLHDLFPPVSGNVSDQFDRPRSFWYRTPVGPFLADSWPFSSGNVFIPIRSILIHFLLFQHDSICRWRLKPFPPNSGGFGTGHQLACFWPLSELWHLVLGTKLACFWPLGELWHDSWLFSPGTVFIIHDPFPPPGVNCWSISPPFFTLRSLQFDSNTRTHVRRKSTGRRPGSPTRRAIRSAPDDRRGCDYHQFCRLRRPPLS